MKHELVIVLDFGGQYKQLIARRVREASVYCEVMPFDTPLSKIKEKNPVGIIFTGGPSVVYEENAPMLEKELFELGIPVLGICYGSQLMGYVLGGEVEKAQHREYGKTDLKVNTNNLMFKDVEENTTCWMSHTYYISKPPVGFEVIATTKTCPVAAMADVEKKLYAVQFHPEVVHTPEGTKMLRNFLYNVCGCKGDWVMTDFAKEQIRLLKEKIGDKKVLCALSGGVDSSVAALLIHKAVGKQLTCIFVDHGLLRKNEGDDVERIFKKEFDMNIIRVNAGEQFISALEGVSDPERKRKIIGEEFIRVFEAEAKKIGTVDFLVQGTIYPDVIESGTKNAAVIKSHHNVGGLPDYVDFKEIIEPLRDLFKDEVRDVGRAIGIPEFLVSRQPFPGPGLAIRIIGDITEDKIAILQDADYIFREEVRNAGLDKEIWQYFAVLTNSKSVGVMGDERTYHYTIALRGVTSIDGMTADWARIPYDVLEKMSVRIVNEVDNVNRIVYDITSKPPATIEWE
ncbi:glutamine-hydrolyzing GMP synthase [Vallitalea guaymasensis]|uniref:glutamine-hydrolyzing GMP synthase n=1 Tax=Vallitalea guaymasensis TaxID=1185412 RepID=UPI000DE3A683|nr:glutamine-hydrolyzing GMP synthase [Vallitalea guaymasensis]